MNINDGLLIELLFICATQNLGKLKDLALKDRGADSARLFTDIEVHKTCTVSNKSGGLCLHASCFKRGNPNALTLMGVTNMTLTGSPVTYGGFPTVGAGLTALACQRTGSVACRAIMLLAFTCLIPGPLALFRCQNMRWVV